MKITLSENIWKPFPNLWQLLIVSLLHSAAVLDSFNLSSHSGFSSTKMEGGVFVLDVLDVSKYILVDSDTYKEHQRNKYMY